MIITLEDMRELLLLDHARDVDDDAIESAIDFIEDDDLRSNLFEAMTMARQHNLLRKDMLWWQ